MCTALDLSEFNFSITIGDEKYSIPFSNLIQQTSNSAGNTPECDLYVVNNYNTEDNAIQVGDPFFSAFFPVFDVDND